MFGIPGKSPQKSDVERGVQLCHGLAVHAQPVGGIVRPAAIKPFRCLKPRAKFLGVFVDSHFLQNQRQGTGRIRVSCELVVVEIIEVRLMPVSDVHHRHTRISQFLLAWITPIDRNREACNQNGAGQKLILMGTAGMCDNDAGHAHESRKELFKQFNQNGSMVGRQFFLDDLMLETRETQVPRHDEIDFNLRNL